MGSSRDSAAREVRCVRQRLRRCASIAAWLSIALFVTLISGCRTSASRETRSAESGGRVTLSVTRDFGLRTLDSKSVPVPASPTVMAVLAKNAKVKTAYGGGFIDSINGLASGYTGTGGSKNDWFYYVNGVQASVGAAEFKLRPGDKVWWDYHDWSHISFVPAVVGSYPEPFVHGFEGKKLPIDVVYADGFAHEAGAVRDTLIHAGAGGVGFSALRPGLARPSESSVVLVGAWSALAKLDWIAQGSRDPAASGLFVRFDKGEARMLDCRGKFSDSQSKAGAILALGESGSPAVAWLLTGTDDAAARRAVDVLIRQPTSLAGKFGIVVDEDSNVIPVPRGAG